MTDPQPSEQPPSPPPETSAPIAAAPAIAAAEAAAPPVASMDSDGPAYVDPVLVELEAFLGDVHRRLAHLEESLVRRGTITPIAQPPIAPPKLAETASSA